MPVSFADVSAYDGAPDLTDAEMLYVRSAMLIFESVASQPNPDELAAAFAALDEAKRQLLRAYIAAYIGGQTVIDGGVEAIEYEPILERWSIRNGVRSLLTDTGLITLEQEPRPGTSDSLQLAYIPLACYGSESEM